MNNNEKQEKEIHKNRDHWFKTTDTLNVRMDFLAKKKMPYGCVCMPRKG